MARPLIIVLLKCFILRVTTDLFLIWAIRPAYRTIKTQINSITKIYLRIKYFAPEKYYTQVVPNNIVLHGSFAPTEKGDLGVGTADLSPDYFGHCYYCCY